MSLVEEQPRFPENVKFVNEGYESEVKYYAGKSVLSGKPAMLRWQQDVISLVQLPTAENNSHKAVFSVKLEEIKSIGQYQTVLDFNTNQGSYKVEFSYKAGVLIGAAGGMRSAGVVAAATGSKTAGKSGKALLESSGYKWWVTNLKARGIKFKQPKLISFIIIGLFLLMLAIFLLPK